MKHRPLLLSLAFALSTLLSATATAQIIDEPVEVALKVRLSGLCFDNIAEQAPSNYLTASIGDNAPLITLEELSGPFFSDVETCSVEVGRYYDFVVYSESVPGAKTVVMSPPPGYNLHVDGDIKTTFTMSGALSIKSFCVLPAVAPFSGPAGSATSLAAGRIHWEASLGSLRNGEPAGSILLAGAGTSSWDGYYKPAGLAIQEESEEIKVYRKNNAAANQPAIQILANEAFVNIVPLTATSYQISFYNPEQSSGSSFPSKARTVTGLPFVTYEVKRAADYNLQIIRQLRSPASASDTAAPVLRTDLTTLQRSGSGLALTWTSTPWTLSGSTSLTQETRVWSAINASNSAAGHNETITIKNPANTALAPAIKSQRTHTGYAWGHTPTQEQLGETSPAINYTDYHNNTAERGSYGFVSASRDNGGAWQAFDYFSTDDGKKLGTISRIYSPLVNTPASVTRDAAQGVVTTLAYAEDPFGMLRRLTSSETRTSGILSAKTTITYSTSNNIVTATRTDQVDSAGLASTTTTKFYKENHTDSFLRNQLYSTTTSAGLRQSYARKRGTWNDSTKTFSAGDSGLASRIVLIEGASASLSGATEYSSHQSVSIDKLWLIPGKSTTATTIRDPFARIARTESHVWTGSAWQLIGWTNYTYNYSHQLTRRETHNGDIYEATYTNGLLASERDAQGVTTQFTYDVNGRLATRTRIHANAASLVTTFTCDAANRIVREEISSPGTTEKLVTTHAYDNAGRLISHTPPGLAATTFAHNPSSRSTTATFPHGGTKTETLTRDGRVDSVTGSAVVPEYYAYAIQSDGRLITRQSIATSSSSRYIRTWTDWLGRAVHIETPPPPGQSAVIAEDHTYNARGLLTKIARSGGFAPILYEYDTIGNLLRSGLDLNANGILDIAGTDRITETDTQIALRSGSTALWDITSRDYTYPVAGNSTRIQTRLSARNLYGATNTLLSSLEQTGSSPLIESTVVPDRANQKLTTTRKQATATQTEILLANQNLTVTTPDGRQFKTENDTLGRPVHSIDPRTGTTTTAYTSGTALVSSVTDPAGYANAFGYDTSGREIWRRDQQNNYARFAYNQRGQITRQWGQAIRPAEFAYNTYGERTTLSSWRNGSNWTASAWDATGATADKITWTFHDATGLLTKKTDAAGKSVDYTYNAQGQVATRLWSRTLSSGARVTATYGYNALTGELLSTASNDGTPTVSRILNRIGLPTTITDATGARTLAWESAAPWQLKTETLPAFYQSRVFTPLYGASGTPLQGETTGWQLGTAASTPANLLSQNYTFNTAGRATGLSSARGANAPGGAATQAFTYAWLANSSLIQTIAATGTSFTQTHTYEAKRNLLTGIIGKWSTATRSAFTYTYDTRGLRASVVQNGDAFDLASAYGNSVRQNFGYNSFREVTSATSYLGTTASTTAQLPGRDFRYTYDPAGNRRTANRHGTDSAQQEDFSVNALNQTTTRENLTAPLDGFSTAATVTVDGGTADKNGNFWQREVTLANSTAPAARQIPVVAGGTTIQKLAFLGPITETLTYDADGNLTGDWRWTYQYDAENRLIAAETKSWAIIANAPLAQRLEFKYDYMGRRVSKIVREKATATAAWTLKSETRFLYDGWNLVAETNASGAILRSYVWGLDLAASPTATGGVGALLQITDHTVSSPQRYFPTYDGNGNIATLVRAADGVLSAVYEYSPFGELLRATGTFADANPFRFSTKYTDTETGLIYYGNRFYDARNGRFINRDPIEERGGFNLYGFCENDSVNQIDYLGYTGTDPDGPCGRWYEDSLILPTVNVTATPLPQFDLSSFLPTSIYQSTGGSVVASGKSSTSSTSSSGSKSSNSKQQIRVPLRGVGFPSGMPSVSSIISQQMQNGLSPGSMLGNLLRHVPFLGGTLGALGDVVSGVGNVTIGIVSFGQSETFGRGIEQVVFGVSVFAADIGAAAYGFSIGKITSVALGVGNLLTGNYFAANYQNDPNPESRGFFSGVSNFVRSVVIPTYGFNLGVNYGGVQQGFVSSEFARSFNQLDAVSYQHDRDQRNRDWVRSSSSSQGEGIPTGPVGAIINIIGAPVFWLTPSR